MRIITPGKLDQTIEVQQTCYKCGTLFAYTKSDVKSDPRGESYVLCPLEGCGAYNSSAPLYEAIKKDRVARFNQDIQPNNP